MSKNKKRSILTFETANYSRDELALKLLTVASKRRLVIKEANRFKNNPRFRNIYNVEFLEGILLETIAKVVNSHEAYILREKGMAIPEGYPELDQNTNLSTFGMLTGYLITSFKQNVSKDYKKHTATKRSFREEVSLEGGPEGCQEESQQSTVIFNQVKCDPIKDVVDKSEYLTVVTQMFNYLREYDKSENNRYFYQYNKKAPKSKQSKLAYLFLNLMDPKFKGKYVYLKDKYPWSPYIFNKNKEKMVHIISSQFKNQSHDLLEYLEGLSDNFGATLMPKRSDVYNFQSTEVKTAFIQKPISEEVSEFYVSATLVFLDNGRINTFSDDSLPESKSNPKKDPYLTKSKVIRAHNEKREEVKSQLYASISAHINKLENEAKAKISLAYNNLYKDKAA